MGAFDDIGTIVVPDPNDHKASEEFRRKWHWDPGEQVILKDRMVVADQKYIAKKMSNMDKQGSIEVDMGNGRYAQLERMIVAWTLTRNGQAMPLSASSIDRLPSWYSTPILEAIDKLVSPMTEKEQNDFLADASEPIEESSNLVKLHQRKS